MRAGRSAPSQSKGCLSAGLPALHHACCSCGTAAVQFFYLGIVRKQGLQVCKMLQTGLVGAGCYGALMHELHSTTSLARHTCRQAAQPAHVQQAQHLSYCQMASAAGAAVAARRRVRAGP